MDNHKLLKYFLLFIVSFLLFSYFQHFPTFPDPDSFYHAKMAILIRDQGIVKDFPWLQFTVLKNYYIDHHFLYHILLVPFVTFSNPLVGVKLATAFFATILILAFYWFLEKTKIKGAFFYSLLLLVINPFIFRINLAKASALSIVILLFGLYFILNRKLRHLFVLSFIYVWLFDGWPLILVLTLFYIISVSIIKAIHFENRGFMNYELGIKKLFVNCKLKIGNFFRAIFARANFKLLLSCLGGLTAGIIINPYFPKNLYFYWYHIVKIAVINYKDVINVGAEWYSYKFFDLISNASFVFILFVIALSALFVFLIKKIIKETVQSSSQNLDKALTLFLIFCFFFILTLRSRRNVEYWVPFAILFSTFLMNDYFPYKFEKLLFKFKGILMKRGLAVRVASLCFVFSFPLIMVKDLSMVKDSYEKGYSVDKYKKVSEWLVQNTPANSVVFHNDWDDFPPLFYYNTHNRYIAGLDPTFMYDYDKELYKRWVDITVGKQDNISEIIKNNFRSEYVFVDKEHVALENNLKRDGHFKMVYKDEEGKIYKLTINN